MENLRRDDPELADLIAAEEHRLAHTINLIAAENHLPVSILEVMGSLLNTKTIEGYPGKRFHAGCGQVDEIERLAIERGKQLYGAEHINVQPHSGTSANLAVYFSVLNLHDHILSMSLPHGGHLSHGHRASVTSRCFQFSHYTVDPATGLIDYEQVRHMAHTIRPRMLVAGASSYPRLIDYRKMAEIAREVSAFFLVDMAHLAGLVAAKVIPSPVPWCDFVTLTCYKTMMGGRGGVILCREQYGSQLDKAVFPGCQGTTPVNLLAAKALIFQLAVRDQFVEVQKNTLKNAVAMAGEFISKGYSVVTGGTENHQVVLDLTNKGMDGPAAEQQLEAVGIVLNRNVVPADSDHPGQVSGIRIGTGAVSARGMGEEQMVQLVDLIDSVLVNPHNQNTTERVLSAVAALCKAYPLPG